MNTIDVHALTEAIATHLDGWSPLDEAGNEWGRGIEGPNPNLPGTTMRLWIRTPSYGSDAGKRLTIQGSYDHLGSTPWRGGGAGLRLQDTITVSATRAPEAIAADIRRRLLPHVEQVSAQMIAETESREDEQAKKADAVERLTKIGEGAYTLREPYDSYDVREAKRWITGQDDSRGEVNVRYGAIEFHSLTPTQVETIMTAYAASIDNRLHKQS